MNVRMTRMETLTNAWESDEHVLRHWGHESQADIVSVCRQAVQEQLARKGDMELGALLTAWADDASVLETFGHGEDASNLLRCRDELEKALDGQPGTGTSRPRRPSRPRRERSAGEGAGGDGTETASVGAQEEESSKRDAWST